MSSSPINRLRIPRAFRLEAVLFDFDGTLTVPGAIDFAAVRRTLGFPEDQPVLEYLAHLEDLDRREELLTALDGFETEAAAVSWPNPGAEEAVRLVRARGLKVGILTRNSRRSVDRALANFPGLGREDFDLIVTRDAPVRPKPHPEAVRYAAQMLDVPVERVALVGDYLYDVQGGEAAGALTVLLANAVPDPAGPPPVAPAEWGVVPDFIIGGLEDLGEVVRLGLPLPLGKLPNDLLASYLAAGGEDDASLLVRPGVGEDTAAVDVGAEEVLVLTADPITFASDAIGRYAVLVNTNDVATAGAVPRWLLTTWLFPPGSTPAEILASLEELRGACREAGLTLVGGHTEITDAVTRPVVAGALLGTAAAAGLIRKDSLAAGDRILLTKALAVEGTAIIARDFGERLLALGMSPAEVDQAAALLERATVTEEARVAVEHGGVSALHDVTEGGLATALEELSVAGGQRLRVHLDRVPVLSATRRVCALLGLDPLGLLGSGSLLIAAGPETVVSLLAALREAGVEVAEIGEAVGPGAGVEALKEGRPVPWPRFAADELTRLYSR